MNHIFTYRFFFLLLITSIFIGCGESEAEIEAAFQEEMAYNEEEVQEDFDKFTAISEGLKQLYSGLEMDTVPNFSLKVSNEEKERAELLRISPYSPLGTELYTEYDEALSPDCRDGGNALLINDTEVDFSDFPSYHALLEEIFSGDAATIPVILERIETGKWVQASEEDKLTIRDPTRIGALAALLLSRVRYVILAKTMLYTVPVAVGEDTFLPGQFGQRFFLYDLHKKQMIGSFYLSIESSNDVSFLTSEQWQDDDTFDYSAKKDLYDNMSQKLNNTVGHALKY